MKFRQTMQYKMRKIFLEKSYTKCGGETIPRPFSKKIKIEHISGSIVSFIQFVLIVCQVGGLSKYIETKMQSLAFTSYKVF